MKINVDFETDDQKRTVELTLPYGWAHDPDTYGKARFVSVKGPVLDIFATELHGVGSEAREKYVGAYDDVSAEYTSILSTGNYYAYLYRPEGAESVSTKEMNALLESINVSKR